MARSQSFGYVANEILCPTDSAQQLQVVLQRQSLLTKNNVQSRRSSDVKERSVLYSSTGPRKPT